MQNPTAFIRAWLTRIRHVSTGLDSRERCRHYSSGLSDCLEEPSEMGHYWMITGYCRIIMSLFDGRNRTATRPIWEEIRRRFQVEDATQLENMPSRKSWTIALLAP